MENYGVPGSPAIVLVFGVASIAIFVLGILQIWMSHLPQFLQDFLLYGKIRGVRENKTFVQKYLEVPKRYACVRCMYLFC